jgi:hypothetical protein
MLFKDRRTGNIVDTGAHALGGPAPMPKYADQLAYGDKSYSGYVFNDRSAVSREGTAKIKALVASNPRVRRVDAARYEENDLKPKKQLQAERIRRNTKNKKYKF